MSFKFWRKRKREKDLDEELTNHIERAARDRVDRGETPVDAAHAARSEFGNTELVKETTRDAWGWRWAGDFAEDVKFGLRTLRTNPGFTAAVVLTLALGIGANTSIFRFVNAVVLRELEVRTPSQLVFPRIISPEASGDDFPYAEFEHIRDHSQSYSGLIALDTTRLAATVDGQPNFVLAQCVSASYFSVLGVNPILGSDFAPRDNQPGRSAWRPAAEKPGPDPWRSSSARGERARGAAAANRPGRR